METAVINPFLQKKANNNSEGGYGSVVGVVLVIVSVSFILSGLMLGLLG